MHFCGFFIPATFYVVNVHLRLIFPQQAFLNEKSGAKRTQTNPNRGLFFNVNDKHRDSAGALINMMLRILTNGAC